MRPRYAVTSTSFETKRFLLPDYDPSFRFSDEDPEIEGRIITRKTVVTRYGDRDVLTMDTFAGRYDVWLTQAALKNWLKSDDPQVGDDVKITYLGSEIIKNDDGTEWIPEGETEPGRRKLFSASRSPRTATVTSLPAAPGGAPHDAYTGDDSIPF